MTEEPKPPQLQLTKEQLIWLNARLHVLSDKLLDAYSDGLKLLLPLEKMLKVEVEQQITTIEENKEEKHGE